MCDSDNHQSFIVDTSVTRRSVLLTMTSAAAMAGMPTSAFAADVVEKDVMVPTPDGKADAVLLYPAGDDQWPAVLMWPDILGLRPVFQQMGHRLASQGYVVLVPNPFYRAKRAPVVTGSIDFNKPDDRAKLMAFKDGLNGAMVEKDATAFINFLDEQKQTDRRKGAGVQGYCFSGPFAFQTGAVRSDRIRAVASFHGGGLVTDKPNSPHHLIPMTKATFLVAIAQNDDASQPEAKTVLKEAFAAAKRPATVDVYHADHGWCVPGSQAYNGPEAERAWAALTDLYRSKLG